MLNPDFMTDVFFMYEGLCYFVFISRYPQQVSSADTAFGAYPTGLCSSPSLLTYDDELDETFDNNAGGNNSTVKLPSL